jgi:predicted TIM-barrel fold metal-dependent hydrolase
VPSPPAPPTDLFAGIKVIDVDTHLTEPHDLWTSRAPRGWEDRVPRVVTVGGDPKWMVDGVELGRAGASSVVRPDGTKSLGSEFIGWTIEQAHPAASNVGRTRLDVMDELGIWGQIVYPNVVGFGGQRFAAVTDPELRLLCARLYNDAMAEIQDASGGRLMPMGMVPWWDIGAAVREVQRMQELGLHGVNTNADPQNHGLPDLADRAWDPFWEICADLGLPVNFHIGGSDTQLSWFGSTPWPSLGDDQKLAVGSAMMYVVNARVLGNIIFSGVLERFPTLKVVSVESGVGWIPFFLEALDHQLMETAPATMDYLSMMPSEYFRRQMFSCFWFECRDLPRVVEQLGADNVMFETDFPHPTCLFPDSLVQVAGVVGGFEPDVRAKLMSGNAARVYNVAVE